MAAGAVATTAAEKHPFTHPGNARTRVKGLRMDWCVSVAAPGEGAGPVGGWLFPGYWYRSRLFWAAPNVQAAQKAENRIIKRSIILAPAWWVCLRSLQKKTRSGAAQVAR